MGTLSQKSHFLGQIFFSSTNSILDLLITCLNCLDFQLPTILTLFHHFITRKGILGLLPALLDMLHHLHQLLLLSTSKAHSKTHTSDNPGQPCVIISVDHRERYIHMYIQFIYSSLSIEEYFVNFQYTAKSFAIIRYSVCVNAAVPECLEDYFQKGALYGQKRH